MSAKITLPRASAKTAVGRRLELLKAFAASRGTMVGANRKAVPRTTGQDVRGLVEYWTRELESNPPPPLDKSLSSRGEWARAAKSALELAATIPPGATYPENPRFWQRDLAKVAIYLDSLSVVPSEFDLALEAVQEAIREAPGLLLEGLDPLLETLKWAAIAGGSLLAVVAVVALAEKGKKE